MDTIPTFTQNGMFQLPQLQNPSAESIHFLHRHIIINNQLLSKPSVINCHLNWSDALVGGTVSMCIRM